MGGAADSAINEICETDSGSNVAFVSKLGPAFNTSAQM